MLSLEVCIATFGARATALHPDRLGPQEGTSYSLFVQGLDDPAEQAALSGLHAGRADIRVIFLPGTGVANSRNAALGMARGDIILFGDDDLVFLSQNYPRLQQAFASDPQLGCLCGTSLNEQGQPRKRRGWLARHGARLRFWNIARTGTPEIAVRRSTAARLGLRFDPGFGAGTDRPIGDELIFLMDGLRAGLSGRHMDIATSVHPQDSSGMAFDERSLALRGAVFRRAFGRAGPVLLAAFALKNWRRFASWRAGLALFARSD